MRMLILRDSFLCFRFLFENARYINSTKEASSKREGDTTTYLFPDESAYLIKHQKMAGILRVSFLCFRFLFERAINQYRDRDRHTGSLSGWIGETLTRDNTWIDMTSDCTTTAVKDRRAWIKEYKATEYAAARLSVPVWWAQLERQDGPSIWLSG